MTKSQARKYERLPSDESVFQETHHQILKDTKRTSTLSISSSSATDIEDPFDQSSAISLSFSTTQEEEEEQQQEEKQESNISTPLLQNGSTPSSSSCFSSPTANEKDRRQLQRSLSEMKRNNISRRLLISPYFIPGITGRAWCLLDEEPHQSKKKRSTTKRIILGGGVGKTFVSSEMRPTTSNLRLRQIGPNSA